jgi:hypothetical protein
MQTTMKHRSTTRRIVRRGVAAGVLVLTLGAFAAPAASASDFPIPPTRMWPPNVWI